jgi:ABC-2 type transport system permease protein
MAADAAEAKLLPAWWHLVTLSFWRHWRSLQIFIALGLVGMLGALVVFQTIRRGWGPTPVPFSSAVIGDLYLSFLLPLLTLSFGTQALGGDWEDRSLVWLLTRPLPRPLVYLAKFVAAIPWTFGLTLGSLVILGALAGKQGLLAVRYFWPSVAWGTLAYLALFLLMGAWFRRSTVIAVVYAFVIETLVGNMPGLVKRCSINFYSRCVLYDLAEHYGYAHEGGQGIAPEKRDLFMPVDGDTAVLVLCLISLAFLLLGMAIFARKEYHNLT